jgi:hypothetical protein
MKKSLVAFIAAACGMAAMFVAIFVAPAMADDVTCYVQDGLIGHWDGVENAGLWTHDSSATIWKDVSGNGYDATQRVTSAGWNWIEDAYVGTERNNHGFLLPAAIHTALKNNITGHTIEVVFKPSASAISSKTRSTIFGQYLSSGMNMEFSPHKTGYFRVYYNAAPDVDTTAWKSNSGRMTCAVVCNGSNCILYEDGSAKKTAAQPAASTISAKQFVIGGEHYRANMSILGELCAVRIYSRALTAAEIAENHTVDVTRFVDGDTRPPPLTITGSPDEIGSPTPGYGAISFAPDETVSLSCPETYSTNGGVVARCVGWRFALKNGLELEGNTTSTNFAFGRDHSGSTFTWLWDTSESLCVEVPEEAANGGATRAYMPVAAGESIAIVAPAAWTNAVGDTATVFTGWTLYDGAGNAVGAGEGTSLEYTHPDPAVPRRLVWNFRHGYRVSASASDGSAVTPAEQWIPEGGSATVTALGDAFSRWSGSSSATTPAVTLENIREPKTLVAVAAPYVRYVGPNGVDDDGHGLTAADPYASIAHAIRDISGVGGTGVVRVAAGTYAPTGTVTLSSAIRIVGAGRDATVLDFKAKTRGFRITHEDAYLTGLVISNCNYGGGGGGASMSNGTIRDCLFTLCIADYASGNGYSGGGVAMSGGLIDGCEFTKCKFMKLYGHGNAINMTGGEVRNCDIHHCDEGYNHSSPSNGGGVVYVQSGTFHHCTVHHNNKESSPGIMQVGGTIYSCLIYANTGKYGAAGIHKYAQGVTNGGNAYNCTIVGNVLAGDTTGVSGITMSSGTLKNCISWGNGPAASAAGSNRITGGTFESNLIDVALTSYPNNIVSGDPKFADAANEDFHIASRASAAYAGGVPVSGVVSDLDGLAFNAGSPSIGCYEYDASSESYGVDVSFDNGNDFPRGAAVSLTAVVSGAEAAEVALAWYVDGSATPAGTSPTLVLDSLDYGSHAIRLVATRAADGAVAEAEIADCIRVRPTVCYVSTTGSGTYPYATPETATNSINEALSALWRASNVTSVIHVAQGSYKLSTTVTLMDQVRILGAGRDTTVISNYPGLAFSVANAAAEVSGITVAKGVRGFSVSSGLIRDCRAIGVVCNVEASGTGFNASGGSIISCEAIDCSHNGLYGYCAGIRISGTSTVVSNCLVRGCSTVSRAYGYGSGVYISGGLLTHSVIENCKGRDNGSKSRGSVLDMTAGSIRWSSLRGGTTSGTAPIALLASASAVNCLFAGNVGTGDFVVGFNDSTVDSCTVTANSGVPTAVSVTGSTSAYNSIFAENAGANLFASTASFSHCCATNLLGGVDGNVSAPPKFHHPERGDYRLAPGSPCINAGDASRWAGYVNPLDLGGLRRRIGGQCDIGCYEYEQHATVLSLK